MVRTHHPPFECGLGHMDAIALCHPGRFAAAIARHRQMERVLRGHHRRPVAALVAHAIASICPSVVHQVELALRLGAPVAFVLEPPACQPHRWTAETGVVSHAAVVESYPRPFPLLADQGYPGQARS